MLKTLFTGKDKEDRGVKASASQNTSSYSDESKIQDFMHKHEKIVLTENARKVAVFIDQENVFYASLHNANSYPDYKVVMGYAESIGRVVKAEAVCDWTRLVNSLKFVVGAGIDPIFCCNASTVSGTTSGQKQSFADGKIYTDVIEFMTHNPCVGIYILVAGSRDYIPLVNYLKGKGKFVIVLCEKVSIAWDLEAVADLCVTLQDINGLVATPDKGNGNTKDHNDQG